MANPNRMQQAKFSAISKKLPDRGFEEHLFLAQVPDQSQEEAELAAWNSGKLTKGQMSKKGRALLDKFLNYAAGDGWK